MVRRARSPGLVVYSEIFQLTAPVRRLAVQLASLGYLVMAPEVYHAYESPGVVLGYDDAGKNRGNALKEVLTLTAFDDDARAVLAALASHPECNGRVGAFGICLGGHLAFRAALQPRCLRPRASIRPTCTAARSVPAAGPTRWPGPARFAAS